MDFSPDGHILAVGTYLGLFYFYDLKTNRFLPGSQIYDFNGIGVSALAFSPDGKLIATGYGGPVGNNPNSSVSTPILLIDDSTGTIIAKASASAPSIRSIAWSSDSKILAAGDGNHHVVLMTGPSLEKAASDVALGEPAMSVKFAPDRPVFAVTSGKNVAVYEVTRR